MHNNRVNIVLSYVLITVPDCNYNSDYMTQRSELNDVYVLYFWFPAA